MSFRFSLLGVCGAWLTWLHVWRSTFAVLGVFIFDFSNCTIYIVKFCIRFDTLFWPIFVDFQNEAASLCINNRNNKDMK